MKKKALIIYISYSGNTKEVAELIRDEIQDEYEVDMNRICGDYPPLKEEYLLYDIVIFGSFTWGKGEVPLDVKNTIAEIGVKHPFTYVFGTGDTQFGGDDLFCMAADKLAVFFNSPLYPLKIEQSPRGSQEKLVKEWSNLVKRSYKDIGGM